MIVAIGMGRKGSKGFPGKNLHPVLGRPMAWWPLKAARDCPEVERVFLSTDDERLMAIASELSIEVIVRPPELTTDHALGEDVYLHGYREARRRVGRELELVVLVMCNAPTVSSPTISEGIRVLRERPEVDSAVSVSRYNMWSPLRARKIGADGLLHPFVDFAAFGDPSKMNCDRDSQGDVWFADMGVSIVRPRCLEEIESGVLPQKWMGRRIHPLRQEAGCDVDYEWQLPGVEWWLARNGAVEEVSDS